MEERDETAYLKQYVKQHPDNRMAWYLLGKEYMLQGKEAKANYCFLQSGDVYEAFELKKHPLTAVTPKQAIERWNRRRSLRGILKRAAPLAVLLMGMTVFAPASPWESAEIVEVRESQDASVAKDGPAATNASRTPAKGVGVVFVKTAAASPIGDALTTLLYGQSKPAYGIAVRLEQDEAWRKWGGRRQLLLSVERTPMVGEATVQMYDPATCACTPSDTSTADSLVSEWTDEKEQHWVLKSAVLRYRQIHGEWPSSLDQLVRPYPANLLSGDTPYMVQAYADVLAEVKRTIDGDNNGQAAGNDAGQGKDSNARSNPLVDPIWNAGIADGLPAEPLEIIVDKANHRLALVSGDVIIRSYAVGLGGSKTPEGTFQISEKVKNPNGRDNGDFGSRGMTLSNTLYAIHGTNEPDSVGKDESLGCVRMLKEDVEELFDMTPIGTKVTITKGVLPDTVSNPEQRFKLESKQDETNPGKVYRWLD
jgi:hypothetical protein